MPEITRTARDANGAPIVDRYQHPVLAVAHYTEGRNAMRLVVQGGLNYLRGNRSPYFSLTATLFENGRDVAGGCMHDEILARFPDLADLAAMHLSDIDGQPMHAEANGWYSLVASIPGAMGERYHAGNSPRHFPKPPEEIDPAKSWQTTDYRNPTTEEALAIFAEHIRAPLAEAERIRSIIASTYRVEIERHKAAGDGTYAAPPSNAEAEARALARNHWRVICQTYVERWKAEAERCISAHDLVIWGDGGLRAPADWKAPE